MNRLPDEWDAVIVGAGPAGSTAALAALAERPSARVLLLDRASFPRDKSCGDGIAPHVMDILCTLGAGCVAEGWTPLRTLELALGDRLVAGPMARQVHVIPREVFDSRLVEMAVAAGACLERHRVRTVQVHGDGAVILDERIRARTVIAADGVHSAVRSALTGPSSGPHAIAIRGYAPTLQAWEGRQVIRYGQTGPQPSYAWAFDRGDGLSNVGYGQLLDDGSRPTRKRLLERLEQLLPGTIEHGTRWRAHHLPLSGRGWRPEHPAGPVLYTGDAAGLVNPMTGEGIFYAVLTGALAGRTAVMATQDGGRGSVGARYRQEVRKALNRHLHHTWLAGHLVRRPAVLTAGIVAAGRDQRMFDDLVELGLGDGRLTPRMVAGIAAGLLHPGPGLMEGH